MGTVKKKVFRLKAAYGGSIDGKLISLVFNDKPKDKTVTTKNKGL